MFIKEAKWISFPESCDSPYVRKQFNAPRIKAASLTVCGLGFFHLYLNGSKVNGEYFIPVWSDYRERDLLNKLFYPLPDKFSHRIYCLKYDVAGFLREGENVLGVTLGNGWYRQTVRNIQGEIQYGNELLLICDLTLEDTSGNVTHIVSDGSFKWKRNHIVHNNLFDGERHDYAFETDGWNMPGLNDADWAAAQETAAPASELCLQDCPGDVIVKKIIPKKLYVDGDTVIYDAGENVTGWAAATAAGEPVKITYAERLNSSEANLPAEERGKPEGLNHYGLDPSFDEYLNAAKGRLLRPDFTWHGFRYFEVKGKTADVYCELVHSDIKVTSFFKSDNAVLNWYYDTFMKTQLQNMHTGVPSDCPHRERLGYTGDGQVVCETALMMLDGKRFYKKWMQDITDCQDINTGHVQHTAPFSGGGGGPGGWGGAMVLVPYQYYKRYGDKEILKRYYGNMLRWLDCMESFSEDGLVVREVEGGWCLGDWCTLDDIKIPEPFVNTYFYIKCLRIVKEIAGILERSENFFDTRIRKCISAIKEKFYDESADSFCGSVQGADAFALELGIAGDKALPRLIKYYDAQGRFDTGIFGTEILLRILAESGQGNLIFKLLTSEKPGSFGYMKKQGATTLWETWIGHWSLNHPMFGASAKFLFSALAGIRQREGAAGFTDFVIEPLLCRGLNYLECGLESEKGFLKVKYQKKDGTVSFEIQKPAGIRALFKHQCTSTELSDGVNKLTFKDETL